jgi:hypothetical protein
MAAVRHDLDHIIPTQALPGLVLPDHTLALDKTAGIEGKLVAATSACRLPPPGATG